MTAEITLLKAKALVERDGVSRRTKLRGSEIRVMVQEKIIDMIERGDGFNVAEKLNELMRCGNAQIELAACALFERFTRDDARADRDNVQEPDAPTREQLIAAGNTIMQALGLQPVDPDGST